MRGLAILGFFLVAPLPAAGGILDSVLCSGDISSEIKGLYEATGRFSAGYIVIEVTNDSADLRITSLTVRFEGRDRQGNFKRLYEDQALDVRPGLGARLYIQTEFSAYSSSEIEVHYMKITNLYGCYD